MTYESAHYFQKDIILEQTEIIIKVIPGKLCFMFCIAFARQHVLCSHGTCIAFPRQHKTRFIQHWYVIHVLGNIKHHLPGTTDHALNCHTSLPFAEAHYLSIWPLIDIQSQDSCSGWIFDTTAVHINT
jgi:hypothetical protein